VSVEQQLERLTDAYLAKILELDEYKRRRQELEQRRHSIAGQVRHLETDVQRHDEMAAMVQSIEAFCQRVAQGLAEATFDERRQLIELIVDRVVVTGEEVEIRYVIPTSQNSEQVRFCHLRLDYFNFPVMAHQFQHSGCSRLMHGKTAESIDNLVTELPCFEDVGSAFQSKDLLNALPLLAKPVIEIGTTSDLSMLQPPMPFVPGLRLLPAPSIRGAVFKEVVNIFGKGGLIIFGDEHIRSPKLVQLSTQLSLGMHRIQGQNPPFDQCWGDKRFESTDLILLLADSGLPEHCSSRHVIATQLMNRMGLLAGSAQGFSVNSQVSMIAGALPRLKATGLIAAALLSLEANEEGGEQFIEELGINAG
jgi:hypothetical protein